MSSLTGEGSGVSDTEEVSIVASVSIGEVEISSEGIEDRGRRTPWPVDLPGLSRVFMYTCIYFSCTFLCIVYDGCHPLGGSLYMSAWVKTQSAWVKTQTIGINYFSSIFTMNCRGTFLYFSYKDQFPRDQFGHFSKDQLPWDHFRLPLREVPLNFQVLELQDPAL